MTCYKADGRVLEHEHADHPNYLGTVEAKYVGPILGNMREIYEAHVGKPAASDDDVRRIQNELHALIFCDRSLALTLFECTYTLWSLKTRRPVYRNLPLGEHLVLQSFAQEKAMTEEQKPKKGAIEIGVEEKEDGFYICFKPNHEAQMAGMAEFAKGPFATSEIAEEAIKDVAKTVAGFLPGGKVHKM
jgi:hypothetical protein